MPEPPGLVLVGRVTHPNAVVSAVGSFAPFPLPVGSELVHSLTDRALADVVDLSQPLDAATSLGTSGHGRRLLVAFAVAVKSYEQAKSKLGERHRLVAGDNGQLKVEGLVLGKAPPHPPPADGRDQGDHADDDEACVLAPAPKGGRLVCGGSAALAVLLPYLSRTVARENWPSDLHVEVRPEPVRGLLEELRSKTPTMVRSLSRSARVRDLVDASMGELIDLASGTQKLTVDAQISDSGIVATTRLEFRSHKSVFARAVMSQSGNSPPVAFWQLPGDADTAFFVRGSDPKLFDHPRARLANVLREAADAAGMPEAERRAASDLAVERTLALFTRGSVVYGKGVDRSAVEKAFDRLNGIDPDDIAGRSEGERVLLEHVLGWHLYQLSEPVAKVGPLLKDWAALWRRPAFTKWRRRSRRRRRRSLVYASCLFPSP